MIVGLTGTSGFVGSRLYKELANNPEEFEIFPIKYDSSGKQSFNISDAILEKTTTLIHCGASTPKNQEEANEIWRAASNVWSTSELVSQQWKNLKHLIFISTLDIYEHGSLISEESRPNPKTLYGWSKLMSEKLVQVFCTKNNIGLTILRLGNLYGPGEEQYQKVIPSFIRSALEHKEINISTTGEEARHFLYIDDAIEMIISRVLSEETQFEVINLIGESSISILDLANLIADLIPNKIKISFKKHPTVGTSHHFDTAKMKSLFSKEQVSIRNGLKEEIRLFKL